MSKIVCHVCGTSYPESAAQCPICGSARPVESMPVEETPETAAGGYTYVKGGRFSKGNVKKRNRGVQPQTRTVKGEKKQKEKSNRGLIITAVVLLMVLIAIVAFIMIRFFFKSDPPAPEPTDPPVISCVDLVLESETTTLTEESYKMQIVVTPVPLTTTDVITYTPDDSGVVTVSETGEVEAIGPGIAMITIRCGEVERTLTIVSTYDPAGELDAFKLNRKEIEFNNAGEKWILYSGDIASSEITWTSDDDSIATFKNGLVVAVKDGITYVHAEYKGQKVSCKILCNFGATGGNTNIGGSGGGIGEDSGDIGGSGGGIGEDTGDVGGSTTETLKFCTLWNTELTDFTLGRNEALTLVIKDSNGEKVSATITVSDETLCSIDGNVITWLESGSGKNGTLTATYNGASATCIIRCG